MTNITQNDITTALQDQVKQAISSNTPLSIQAGNSKRFYGHSVDENTNAKPLDLSSHTGIINYDPTELCATVQAGTKLSELEALLAQNNQILAFEPPHYPSGTNNQDTATIGGAIATGIAGPRRAYTGSVRDAILGVKMINGTGEIANFGGEVMKNVAGYDLSRMMVRSQGTLGVILSVSVRVIPQPEQNMTLAFDASQTEALSYFQELRKTNLPITATAWLNDQGLIRVSASEQVLKSCKSKIKGDEITNGGDFWQGLRDHTHEFFNKNRPLWRFSLPPASSSVIPLDDAQLLEWDGAQRWVHSNTPANIIQDIAKPHNGYATLFNSNSRIETHNNLSNMDIFPALEPALLTLHQSLKSQMDPQGIFNPNRIYRGL